MHSTKTKSLMFSLTLVVSLSTCIPSHASQGWLNLLGKHWSKVVAGAVVIGAASWAMYKYWAEIHPPQQHVPAPAAVQADHDQEQPLTLDQHKAHIARTEAQIARLDAAKPEILARASQAGFEAGIDVGLTMALPCSIVFTGAASYGITQHLCRNCSTTTTQLTALGVSAISSCITTKLGLDLCRRIHRRQDGEHVLNQ